MLPNFTILDPVIDGTPITGSNTYNPNVVKTNNDFKIIKDYSDKPNGGSGWTGDEIADSTLNLKHFTSNIKKITGGGFGVNIPTSPGITTANGSVVMPIENAYLIINVKVSTETAGTAGRHIYFGIVELSKSSNFATLIVQDTFRYSTFTTTNGLQAMYHDNYYTNHLQITNAINDTIYARVRIATQAGSFFTAGETQMIITTIKTPTN